MTIKLGFLASGGGSSIEEIVKKIQSGRLHGYSAGVVMCNKPFGYAGVHVRGERIGLNVKYCKDSLDQLEIFKKFDVDLVLWLGYLKKVGDEILNYFPNMVWNIHPSLLPKHGGEVCMG